MSMAQDIAAKVSKSAPAVDSTDGESADSTTPTEPGDHGKRMLAAIKANDAIALETAVKDCVDDTSY